MTTEPSGRKPALPFVMVPHWIILAPISAEALRVYTILVGHVNQTDPANRLAWPTHKRIAAMCHFKDPDTVIRYIRELEAIDVISVRRGRHPLQPMRKRNYYTVTLAFDPAPDGTPVLMFAEFVEELDGDEFENVSAGEDGTRQSPGSVAPEPAGTQRQGPAGGTEPGVYRVREPGSDRVSEPSGRRVEVEVVELDQGKKEALPGSASVERSLDAVDRLPQDPIYLVDTPRPNGRATTRRESPCGNPLCLDGVLKLGINRRPCHVCAAAA